MTVAPEDAYDDHVLVACPRCGERATIDSRSGFERLFCPNCGLMKGVTPRSAGAGPINPHTMLAVYGGVQTPFGARLWLETECCGGRRLWALNERHLGYLEAFVRSTDRTRMFPSEPGNRQLADRLPAWIVVAKHRDEVLRAVARLRTTLT